MYKTLIVKETPRSVILKVRVQRDEGVTLGAIEVARFNKSGMGYCALGAAGRMMAESISLDAIEYDGTRDLYDRLVGMGVIIPDKHLVIT